jgi:hypothetical protein
VILMVIVTALTVIQFRYIERRVNTDGREPSRWGTLFTHLVLILGVALVAFPVYVADHRLDACRPGTFVSRGHPAPAGNACDRKLHDGDAARTRPGRHAADHG